MVFPKKDVFWVKEWGMEGEEARSGGGIRTGVREQRGAELEGAYASSGGDKIHSRSLVHLVRSRGAAAKPRNRAL